MSKQYNLFSAVAAFLLWGGWAYYINTDNSHQGFISALVQGCASFLITLFMIGSVNWFFKRLSGGFKQMLLPPLFTVAITSCFLIVSHWIAQTPHILETISPALVVAFLFGLYTTYKLRKEFNNE